MAELEPSVSSVAARTAGNSVSPGVQALLMAAGMPIAAATATGALAGALVEQGVLLAAELRRDRAARVERFADSAADACGCTLGDLLTSTFTSPEKRELLALAVESASRSLDGQKIDLLARIYVAAAIGDRVDEAALLLEAVRDLEGPHIRLLRLMKEGPQGSYGIWTIGELATSDPALVAIGDALISRLQRSGFVASVGTPGRGAATTGKHAVFDIAPRWQLTTFGVRCAEYLSTRAGRP